MRFYEVPWSSHQIFLSFYEIPWPSMVSPFLSSPSMTFHGLSSTSGAFLPWSHSFHDLPWPSTTFHLLLGPSCLCPLPSMAYHTFPEHIQRCFSGSGDLPHLFSSTPLFGEFPPVFLPFHLFSALSLPIWRLLQNSAEKCRKC